MHFGRNIFQNDTVQHRQRQKIYKLDLFVFNKKDLQPKGRAFREPFCPLFLIKKKKIQDFQQKKTKHGGFLYKQTAIHEVVKTFNAWSITYFQTLHEDVMFTFLNKQPLWNEKWHKIWKLNLIRFIDIVGYTKIKR